jgi:hypothetical protein
MGKSGYSRKVKNRMSGGGMNFSTAAADERVLDAEFTNDALSVSLRDGRIIAVPLVSAPAERHARAAQ